MTVPVSIVVVSRARPALLLRCLTGLAQMDYATFEIVVVACAQGVAAVSASPFADLVKLQSFDAPNIAAARNAGIGLAAGQVIAFVDDDAVPAPRWLSYLVDAMTRLNADAAGGEVLGRNGISVQWGARVVDAQGVSHAYAAPDRAPFILQPDPGFAARTEGTNMAVRRDVLLALGGFDAAYRFFLDETDLNWRLSLAGYRTAFVPDARVHHSFAAGPYRRSDRAPTDLEQLGASQAVFLRKHADQADRDGGWRRFYQDQRHRVLRAMQKGGIGAGDVARLLRGLRRGYRDGQTREIGVAAAFDDPPPAFKPVTPAMAGHRVFATRPSGAATAHAAARDWVSKGGVSSLFILSRSALYHHVVFSDDGVWVQWGGLWGRSDRAGPLIQPFRFKSRVEHETRRVLTDRGDPVARQ